MDLVPDTHNCGLHMGRECRERFPHHRLQRKLLVSEPGMHHARAVMHVQIANPVAVKTFPAFPAHPQPTILVSGKRPMHLWRERVSHSSPYLVQKRPKAKTSYFLRLWGNPPVAGRSPSQRTVMRITFSWHDANMVSFCLKPNQLNNRQLGLQQTSIQLCMWKSIMLYSETRQIRTPVLRIPPAVTSQAKMKNWLHECQKWVSHMIGQYAHI